MAKQFVVGFSNILNTSGCLFYINALALAFELSVWCNDQTTYSREMLKIWLRLFGAQ